jgi:hypothetical protein
MSETPTPSRWQKFWLLCPLFSYFGLLGFILESSAKPQFFQELQAHGLGFALDSMDQKYVESAIREAEGFAIAAGSYDIIAIL